MDISKLMAALAVSGGVLHPQGHVQEGAKRSVPLSVDYRHMSERWGKSPEEIEKAPQIDGAAEKITNKYGLGVYNKGPEDVMAIHGAGFKAQDDIARALEDRESKEAMYLANAILKGAYAAGLPDKLTKDAPDYPTNGDIRDMKRISGNNYIRPMMGFSALMDLMKSQMPEQNWDVSAGVMPNSTAVGLTFNKRF